LQKPISILSATPSAFRRLDRWRLYFYTGAARGKPLGCEQYASIGFVGDQVKQTSLFVVLLDKGQSAISDGAGVLTRNGLDWTKRVSLIAGALDIQGQAIIDGEVVVVKDGRTNFSALQAELAAGQQDNLIFYAFDLLWRDGDLRKLPQIERKQALSDLLGENGIELPVIYSEHLIGDGQVMFEHAAKLNLNFEGIVSKRADAPYRSERTEAWLKVQTVQTGNSRSLGLTRTRPGLRRCIWESAKAKIWSTWARSAPVGRGPSPARSGSSSTPW
jgi:hypothetical protein